MGETRMVKVHCKKCNEIFSLDIGDKTKEEVEKWLQKKDGINCPGGHVEFGSADSYWEIQWDTLHEVEKITQEDMRSNLEKQYKVVLNTAELTRDYDVRAYTPYKMCVAVNKETQKEVIFDFVQAPEERLYYAQAKPLVL